MTSGTDGFVALPNGIMPERRRVPRYSTQVTARLRSAYGDETEVMLADISIHGCSVRTDVDWLRAGSFVTIKLEEDPILQGIVRWVRNGAAGVEFAQPLSSEHVEWHALTTNCHAP